MQVVLHVFGRDMDHLADFARRDDVARELAGRRADVVEANHMRDAGPLGGFGHLQRFGRRAAQRLFAQHVLALRDGRQRHRQVRARRSGDDHGIDVGIAYQALPVAGGAPPAPGLRVLACAGVGGCGQHLAHR
jgi:hypothetical protein